MGWNTTVVVMNDCLESIRNDERFGAKLVEAIGRNIVTRKREDVSAGNCVNAATVIEQHHNMNYVVVAIGGNDGIVLGYVPECLASVDDVNERKIGIVKFLADQLDLRVSKKTKKVKR